MTLRYSHVKIHACLATSRFFTGITFVFCGVSSFRAFEAMKMPAPHNEKQTKTIASFTIQLTDRTLSLEFSQHVAPGGGGR